MQNKYHCNRCETNFTSPNSTRFAICPKCGARGEGGDIVVWVEKFHGSFFGRFML